MAQPKRKWSKRRTSVRRATWQIEDKKYGQCPHCHEPILPHTVCSNCGYYNGKEVIAKAVSEEE